MHRELKMALANMPSDHDAAGDYRPSVEEVFSPDQHANALDPNSPIVVGARGTGKSFWAGVLEQESTRSFAAAVYPHIGLDRLEVRAGYTGFTGGSSVTAKVIDARVPVGEELTTGYILWNVVVIRAARSVLDPEADIPTIKKMMEEFSDPEDLESEISTLDKKMAASGKVLLVTFDALDTWSTDWKRSVALTDSLFRVVWSLRICRALKTKVFIRPEQLNDEMLEFVEMPKLRSGRVQLEWSITDLYGLLYWRMSEFSGTAKSQFTGLLGGVVPRPGVDRIKKRRTWRLLFDRGLQEAVMETMAGKYMGNGHKKGRVYEWPYKHLADARGEVTPRSFIKLFTEAAKVSDADSDLVVQPDGMRHGLREASKVRVDQLVVEYRWVKRALAPLAGVRVPCETAKIYERWSRSKTVDVILAAARDPASGFMPPFPPRNTRGADKNERLLQAMERIGVVSFRADSRLDMPDLFRVAANMLKKGGVAPKL